MTNHPGPEGPDRASAVRRQLAELVQRHGPALLDDSRRVRAMLADAVAGATAEANLVGLALSAGVADKLTRARSSGQDGEQAAETVAAELERTSSVQPDDARWVVGAVAQALGLATTRPQPAPAAGPPRTDVVDRLVVRVDGREHVAAAGSALTLGRDPAGSVVLDSTTVSRQHARIEQGPSGTWTVTDLDSTQGTFVSGRRIRTHELTGPTEVVLGQGDAAVRLSVVPPVRADRTAGGPAGAPVADTVVPQRPGGRAVELPAAATEVGRPPATGQTITVSLGAATKVVTPGRSITVGREVDNDLVATGSTVSRHHLRVEHRDGGWHLVDLGSSSGTWHDGTRVGDLALSGRQELVVGDGDRGDRLVVEAPTVARRTPVVARLAGSPASSPRRWRTPILAAVSVALVLGLISAAYLVWRGEEPPQAAAAALTPEELARGTVYLEWSDATQTVSGSGTVVDADQGLILTNAHVVAPAALGSGIRDGYRLFSAAVKNPTAVEVSVARGIGEPVQPRFTATVVAADGYLDLAVLKIEKTTSGGFVEPEDLADLTEVPLGDSDTLEPTDELTVIGYPGAQGSLGSTYGPAVVSGWTGDDRIGTNRAEINSTAAVAHGNSGGLAADAEGRLVAVPTLLRADNLAAPGETPDYTTVGSALRPVNLAKPLIEAARAGETYRTPYSTAKPRGARILGVSADVFVEPGDDGSIGKGCNADTATYPTWAFGVRYRGFSGGEHTDVVAVLTDPATGEVIDYATTPWTTSLPRSGCLTITTSLRTLPDHVAMTIAVGGDVVPIWERVLW